MANVGPFINSRPSTTFNVGRDFYLETITNYFKDNRGILSTPMTTNAVAYLYSSLALNKMKKANITRKQVSPDIQLTLIPSAPGIYSILEKTGSIKKGMLTSYLGNSDKKDAFFINVMLSKYQSRGEMKLASTNPMDKPLLNPRYLSHPEDIKILVDGELKNNKDCHD